MNPRLKLLSLALLGLLWTHCSPHVARAELLLSIDSLSPTVVAPGELVTFDVLLSGLDSLEPGDSIFSFSLHIGASSPELTRFGTDFTRFDFDLDTSLAGALAFDDDISDDGHVEFGFESLVPKGVLNLGQLSVVAPREGVYAVHFQVDPQDPIAGGTFLLIDDETEFGLLAPGDLSLRVGGAKFQVVETAAVPEPTTLVFALSGGVMLLFARFRNRRGD